MDGGAKRSAPPDEKKKGKTMGVVFKHTLKNMFSKPFRTIMLVLCIVICSFAGTMTFDMSNSVRNVLNSAFLSMFGDSNVMVTGNAGIEEKDFEGLPEHDKASRCTRDTHRPDGL